MVTTGPLGCSYRPTETETETEGKAKGPAHRAGPFVYLR